MYIFLQIINICALTGKTEDRSDKHNILYSAKTNDIGKYEEEKVK